MVLNAAVQAIKQAEELKQKVLLEYSNVSNPSKTLAVAQLQKAYQNILLMDLDFALNRKVEQDLWNVGFKNQIEFLQNSAKDKKNSRRADSQTLLSWVLQSATGFYVCFLHQICNAFKVELPFRCDIPYMEADVNFPFTIKPPQSASCWYIIQHCLVHLGDLARYNRQTRRADSFYRQALNVSPRNGQPYNQLGLLRAARGDRLGAAYYHARGIAVGGPFPPAANNLARTLASASSFNAIPQKKSKSPDFDNSGFSSITRLNSQSYINNYITVHHQLQSGNDLNNTDGNISELNSTLIALVATDEFTHDVLLKMCCLDLYALYSITEGYKIDVSSLSEDEKKIFSLLMKLIAGSLTALLLPAHTRAPQELVTYSALPAIKLIFEWICLQPDTLKHQAFVSRPQLWPGLCMLLNNLQDSIKEFPGEEYKTLPLPEDDELQGFLPIDRAFLDLKFDEKSRYQQTDIEADNEKSFTAEQINSKMNDVLQKHCILKSKSWQSPSPNFERTLLSKKDPNFFNSLRAYRLTHIGERLSSYLKDNGMDFFNFNFDSEKNLKTFTPIQNSLENSEVLKTIQELSLLREKHLNEANTQKNPVISQEDEGDMSDSDIKNDNVIKNTVDENISANEINLISEADFREKVREKRAGILKPQGSLEKARGEKALSRSCRIDVASPELLKSLNDTTVDVSDVQDTGSSSSTVSQDGTIYSDIGSLLDPPILINDKPITKKEGKKTRTNVAMQAIMRKQEESSKQVKFLTPATTPDSVTESFDVLSESKNQMEKRKIIQPKVLKSLNCIPTDRKTGGILSLKDKSAGYPHLVNTESNSEIEKNDNQEDTASKDEMSSKMVTSDSVLTKDVEKPKTSPGHKPGKNAEVNPRNQENYKQSPYTPWSVGNHNSRPFINVEDNWKLDQNMQNLNIAQNNPGCYSYFPTPSAAQKIHNSGISLPVVNPKEIDVRSISTQRQRNPQMPMNDPQYGHFPNKQYDSNPYSCWNSFDGKDDTKFNNLPPRLANYKNLPNVYNPPDRNFSNITPDNRNFDALNQSASSSWWKPVENKSMPNFQPNSSIIRNPGNFNFQTMNQNPPFIRYSEASTNMFQRPPYNSGFNPYQQQPQSQPQPNYSFPHGMYSGVRMPQSVQTPIGGEFLHNNPDAYGMLQNMNSNRNVPFMQEIPKRAFNTDIPEFIPRTADNKNPGTPSKDVGNTSIYSLFSGPESPWQTKNPKTPGDSTPQQSLWPASGQSPLERLLEQQKQFKYPPTDS